LSVDQEHRGARMTRNCASDSTDARSRCR
jgi:hypothetical protein